MIKKRVKIAGFQHETNSFADNPATLAEFQMADSWPGLLQGDAVISGTKGIPLPIAGFAKAAYNVELLPILWCAAEPSGLVSDHAFDTISSMILDGLADPSSFDAVYLDLHGAMITQSYSDGEAELLRRIRQQIGSDMPIVISLDLHANISPALVEYCDGITIYRTYPHIDMAVTGSRAFGLLEHILAMGKPAKAFRQVPYLIPLPGQFTGAGPCAEFYRVLEIEAAQSGCFADIALGFTAGDVPDCGPSIVAYAAHQDEADAIADRLLDRVLAAESRFETGLMDAKTAADTAMQAAGGGAPVVIADVQDNPGAGATSDTTGLLYALAEAGATGVMLGLICDPDMAKAAHHAGLGGLVEGALGGKSGLDEGPFVGRFRVEALSNGVCAFTGEIYGGSIAQLGQSCLLKVLDRDCDIRIAVSSIRSQCLDQAIFTHLGADPALARILVVKSTVHYRADFEPIAKRIIEAAAPGGFPCTLEIQAYSNLREGLRVGPLGRPFPG